MRALAHPLRWALIDALATEQVATATRCAEITGESQASCSFHLRQLAKYGFVVEAQTESKRERPWRLVTLDQSWSNEQPDEARTRAAAELSRIFAERESWKLLRWLRTSSSYPRAWRRAGGIMGRQTWLTATELREITKQIADIVEPYLDRISDDGLRPRGARQVRILAAFYPLPEHE